jgi:hypothetical protein
MKVLTRKTLKDWKCGNPYCTDDHPVIYVNNLCCVDKDDNGAPMEVTYEKATGLLTLICVACDEPLAVFQIADNVRPALEVH